MSNAMGQLAVKPIETRYNGIRFRSRLEARWAVFFDEIGVDYWYEPEGFELPSGERYLPDFFLPRLKMWVEIKGQHPGSDYMEKLRLFSRSIGEALLVCIGAPYDRMCRLLAWDVTESGCGGEWEGDVIPMAWVGGGFAPMAFLSPGDTRDESFRAIYADECMTHRLVVLHRPITPEGVGSLNLLDTTRQAVERAKSERFGT